MSDSTAPHKSHFLRHVIAVVILIAVAYVVLKIVAHLVLIGVILIAIAAVAIYVAIVIHRFKKHRAARRTARQNVGL